MVDDVRASDAAEVGDGAYERYGFLEVHVLSPCELMRNRDFAKLRNVAKRGRKFKGWKCFTGIFLRAFCERRCCEFC
jgi:hypothetical protein